MKKSTLGVIAAFLLMTSFTPQLNAATATVTAATSETKTSQQAKADALIARIYEINTMDKSKLSPPERTSLRAEVITIKKTLHELGGVYISVGAIIIILLLIIILF